MRSRHPGATGSTEWATPDPAREAATEGLLLYFVRANPRRTAVLVALLLVAGLAEGFGLMTLLPLLEVAVDGSVGAGAAGRAALAVLAAVGVPATAVSLLVLIVAALWLKGLFRWMAMRRVGYMVAGVARDLRVRLAGALLAARWGHLGRERTGDIATAVSRDAFWAAYGYRHAGAAAAALIEALAYGAAVLVVSWRLGALALGGAVVLAWILGVFVRMSRRAGTEQTARARHLVSGLLDVVGVVKAIKAMARESGYLSVLRRSADSLERAERRQVLAVESLQAFREPLLALLVAPVVAVVLATDEVAVPTLLVSVLLLYRLIGRLHQVQADYQGMVTAEGAFLALHRQTVAAEAEREPGGGSRPAPVLDDRIEVRGVSFAHGSRVVLAEAELEIPARSLVVLSGPSGAGKSTLLDLLLGLRMPSAGAVLVDGQSLTETDLASWRRQVGYVPQEPVLLRDTVAANVALGATVSDAEVERALRRAGAWSFVAALPDGIHGMVEERGGSLSGGERQRIALARALVTGPRLLVLDEATSELDPASETAIWQALRALRSEMTVVAVSHRAVDPSGVDRVYEVRAGRVERVETAGATS